MIVDELKRNIPLAWSGEHKHEISILQHMKSPTSEYDSDIIFYANKYLPNHDWRLIKAQLIAESDLKPNAVSPAGAQGIAQFMPETWQYMRQRMHEHPGDPFDPKAGIATCCFYMRNLLDFWSWPRPKIDQYCLALASYNAGPGNLLKAQKQANNSPMYGKIIRRLPDVTGKHASETRNYVRKIMIGWLTISEVIA